MARASNRPIYGIVMMLISMSCIAIVDALGKRVIATMPQLEVVGLYFLIIWILSLFAVRSNPRRETRSNHLDLVAGGISHLLSRI